jgi:hypothetical protein
LLKSPCPMSWSSSVTKINFTHRNGTPHVCNDQQTIAPKWLLG